ncbi:LruC domain-containing protein, partial [Bacteroides sp. OttesenSCG-928-D19]|nr:LruC domain-containing protein [Bacteroides sp. OttesenSCG-928-D19]
VQTSRSANANRNEWNCYEPAGITAEEIAAVTKWFEENQNPVSISIDWTNFFIQHVSASSTNISYMNRLVAANDDHVNNFNANVGSIMLMQNSGTSSFGYHNSKDSQSHYNYSIQCIDGGYYVGFDFEANGQNPNEQQPADGYYSDWIIKVSPANYMDAKRIIAEDLGDSDDFDFNDVVFDVALNKQGTTVVTLQAAGGTLPLYIEVGSESIEVHECFGVPTTTMVNTGKSAQITPVVFRLPSCNSVDDVKIRVADAVAGNYYLKAESGKAPQKICVPTTYEWTNERQSIDSKYPKFKDWVGNSETDWLN